MPEQNQRPTWVDDDGQIIDTPQGKAFRAVGSSPAMSDPKLQSEQAQARAMRKLSDLYQVLLQHAAVLYDRERTKDIPPGADEQLGPGVLGNSSLGPILDLSPIAIDGPTWLDPTDQTLYAEARLPVSKAFEKIVAEIVDDPDARSWVQKNQKMLFDTYQTKPASSRLRTGDPPPVRAPASSSD